MWRKIDKRPGSYHRQVKKEYLKMMGRAMPTTASSHEVVDDSNVPVLEDLTESDDEKMFDDEDDNWIKPSTQKSNDDEIYRHADEGNEIDYDESTAADEEVDFPLDEITRNVELRSDIIAWTLHNNISHSALKELVAIINKFSGKELLPKDPPKLLQTPRVTKIESLGKHQYYWHNGLKFCLENVFAGISNSMTAISLNFNMDGLPIFKSSKSEFWPIICNITEMPSIKPMVIGICFLMCNFV